MAVQPISPSDAKRSIPDFVIEAVNELIAENVTKGRFTIRQKVIIQRIKTKTEQEFDMRWLDFEQTFRDAGWNVNYDGPGYNESYEPYFEFSAK